MPLHSTYIAPGHHRRRASKGPSNQQDADCDDLDDEEQFLNLDDVLEGRPELPTCFACAPCWHTLQALELKVTISDFKSKNLLCLTREFSSFTPPRI